MFGMRFSRALAVATAGTLIMASVAYADTLNADADELATDTPHGNSTTADQQPGTTFDYDFSAYVHETGNDRDDVFPGTVIVAIAASGDWLASSALSATSFSFTSYNANQAGTVSVFVPCGTTANTQKTMTVTLTPGASTNGQSLSTASVSLAYAITAKGADAATCVTTPTNEAPELTWTANPALADEGDSKTYSFSIADSDSTSWSFVTDSPSCGTGGTLVSSSIDDDAMTGTFDCSFPDGPALPTVSAMVSDGIDDSNELTQTVTVSNVKPTPTITNLTGNSGAACIAGNTVSLSFSWTDPAGTSDTYDYSVNWGDGPTATTAGNATSPVTGLQHTYAAGGPYQIAVTVNDEDPGAANAAATSASFSFLYNVTGVLQPVNDTQAKNDPSIFKYGSTIPVKIRVTDCDGIPVPGLAPTISVQKMSGTTPSGTEETVISTSGADTGNIMRFDAAAGQYIYNLATKSLADSSATYQLKITGPFADVITLFGTKAK